MQRVRNSSTVTRSWAAATARNALTGSEKKTAAPAAGGFGREFTAGAAVPASGGDWTRDLEICLAEAVIQPAPHIRQLGKCRGEGCAGIHPMLSQSESPAQQGSSRATSRWKH